MEFRVLGPLQIVQVSGEVTAVRRAKPAAVLAILVMHARHTVAVDRFVGALWDDRPPATAVKTLQTYVAQLRRLFGDDREHLITTHTGYRLEVADGAIDAGRFEQQIRQGHERLKDDPDASLRYFVDALDLWRGSPYAEFAFAEFAHDEIGRLEELRLVAQEGRIEASLRSGRGAEIIADLHELTRRHPLREGLWGQLMRALYQSGRQAEALGAFTQVRDVLARELGVDPGPELRRLEAGILAQDLDPPASGEATAAVETQLAPQAEQRWITVAHVAADAGLLRHADAVAATVRRYEGTVLTLDDTAAVLAFGVPLAHDDDSERAVRCARDLRAALRGDGVATRAGISAGEARIDPDHPDAAGGAPFDAARRLALLAEGSAVDVSSDVRHATRRAIRYRRTASGFTVADVIRGARGVFAGRVPLIGRDTEMGLLDSLWELAHRTARPHLVTIVGAPGTGKSRLVAEFTERLRRRDVRVVTGRSLPYGDAVFGAVGEVVRNILAVTEDEPVRELRWKIEQWLQTFMPPDEQHRLAEYVVTLLSVLGDIAEIRESTTTSLRRMFELAAADRPTVVVFEDLHWAHPDLLTLVERTVAQTIGAPLLVIGVARAELFDVRPEWGAGLTGHTALSLQPLSPVDTRALADELLAHAGTPASMLDADAAGGNPLFVEELVAWKLEGWAEGTVPATLRSVIDARLDSLPDGARRVAIDAAVVGNHFWPGAVAALVGTRIGRLPAWLDLLEERGVIVRRPLSTMRNEREYMFRHDLIAEVAYARVPAELRPAKHFEVGRWLEAQPSAPPAALGHHWREAGDVDRAVAYLCAAAEEANTGSQRQRAVALYQQAMDLVRDTDPEQWRRINLRRAVALQAWAHAVLDVDRLRMAGSEGPVSPPDPPG